MSNLLVIVASSRKESDTKKFVQLIFSGEEIDMIDLLDYYIAPYDYANNYPANDNFLDIANIITSHDVIVFATPVYWYAMSGSMKILFDRFTDIVTTKKLVGRQWKSKSVFLIAVGTDPEIPPGFEIPFKLTAGYLDMHYKEAIYFSTKKESIENTVNEKIESFLRIFKDTE